MFINQIKQGAIPGQYVPAVEQGIRDAATSGPLAGYPVVNVAVTLLGGKHHPVDSSDVAFARAGAIAFMSALDDASPVFLEPIMRLEVVVPEPYVGAITGDLNARRADITAMTHRGSYHRLLAKVPLAATFGYATGLRSLTQGRGWYTMEPLTYGVAPAEVAAKLA